MGSWTKATLNKEEYKGLFKLFLQWSNCVRCLPVLCLAFAQLFFVPAASAEFFVSGRTVGYNTDSGAKIRNEGKTTAIAPATLQQGEFTLTYFKQNRQAAAIAAGNSDTQFGVIAPADSPAPRTILAVYGDTLTVLAGAGNNTVNDTVISNAVYDSFGLVYDTIYLNVDTVGIKDTLNYIFSVANYANAFDTIGLIVDTAWSRYGADTLGNFQYQFFDSRGLPLTGVLYGVQEDTARLGLGPNEAETVMLRIYTATNVAGDTVRAAIRAYANNATGRFPGASAEVFSYTGFNGVNYGGDGNDATFIDVTASGPVIRYAKDDTVFSPIAVYGSSDTQRYIPGSLIVYTIWFDNDGNDTSDTIVIDDWIDTRYLRFDSAGLSQLQGLTQVSASGAHIDSGYGAIFRDSAMPSFGTGFRVNLYYSAGAATPVTPLTAATRLENVGRIRWEIGRTGGVVGASNGDDVNNVDSLNLNPGLTAADVDRGYVRFSVVIR